MPYNGREVAEMLGMSHKTLMKKMQEVGIVGVQDPADKRQRLYTDEQIARIPIAQRRDTVRNLKDQVAALTVRLERLEQRLSDNERRYRDLHEDNRALQKVVATIMQQITTPPRSSPRDSRIFSLPEDKHLPG